MKNSGGFDNYSLQDVLSLHRFQGNGLPVAHLGVLRGFNGGAGILVEFGSISSPLNRQFLKNNAYKIGRLIAESVYHYFYGVDPILKFIRIR